MAVKSTRCQDIDLAYEECGQGPTLLLLHGNSETHHIFDALLPALAKQFHVYALDTRGHGQTNLGSLPFSIRTFADDLLCFMNELNIESAHILGFSDGGNVALTFALAHQKRLKSIILVGANCFPAGLTRVSQISMNMEETLFRFLAYFSPKAKKRLPYLELMTREPNISFASLAAIDLPCLVVAGEYDMIRQQHSREIASALPQGHLCILSGRDHFAITKAPADVLSAGMDFWNSILD